MEPPQPENHEDLNHDVGDGIRLDPSRVIRLKVRAIHPSRMSLSRQARRIQRKCTAFCIRSAVNRKGVAPIRAMEIALGMYCHDGIRTGYQRCEWQISTRHGGCKAGERVFRTARLSCAGQCGLTTDLNHQVAGRYLPISRAVSYIESRTMLPGGIIEASKTIYRSILSLPATVAALMARRRWFYGA